MKRYIPVFSTLLVLLIIVIAGSSYLAAPPPPKAPPAKTKILAYTTLPSEIVATISEQYEQYNGVGVNFITLSQDEILRRLKEQANGRELNASLLLADRDTAERAAVEGYLIPYISEYTDQVPFKFRHVNDFWIGIWYDPIVFCFNHDYLRTHIDIPFSWQALSQQQDIRVGITDLVTADALANLYYSMAANYGVAEALQLWSAIKPNITQYSRYLSTPVRQAGMGEVDMAIATLSETARYINDGYPLHVVYPSDGTSKMLFAAGIVFKAKEADVREAQLFTDWLLTDEPQWLLVKKKIYFLTTNPNTLAYKSFAGKNIFLFEADPQYSGIEKQELLDRWVKEVRFQ